MNERSAFSFPSSWLSWMSHRNKRAKLVWSSVSCLLGFPTKQFNGSKLASSAGLGFSFSSVLLVEILLCTLELDLDAGI